MTEQPQIRFEDGAAYEEYMGVWSRKLGEAFLDWLSPPKGLSWLDVGCGNGAFTALLAERAVPSAIFAVDPSPAQLDFARKRAGLESARFEQADAASLPARESSIDAAVMALVIVFVPDPAAALAEIRRVVKPGGLVCAYMWDLPAGGFPFHRVHEVAEEAGVAAVRPPSWDDSRMERMDALWRGAGFEEVDTRVFTTERTFPDLETLWALAQNSPRLAAAASTMTPERRQAIKAELGRRLGAADGVPVTLTARANAIRGRVPG
jgi:SAM-dependent methyltransferase